ncbi:unnamed protein product [Caenorhabditis nigoni]
MDEKSIHLMRRSRIRAFVLPDILWYYSVLSNTHNPINLSIRSLPEVLAVHLPAISFSHLRVLNGGRDDVL